MTRGGTDVGALFGRALERSADAAGLSLAIERASATRWASATFTGTRHDLTLTLAPGPAAAAWLATLPEAEWTIRGQLVADLRVMRAAVTADRLTAVIEALTVEDR